MAARQVRALLMGGQACILYGAAQFSKDIDFTISAEPANWERLMSALQELQAECIAVPLLALAAAGKMDEMRAALAEEQQREGEKDRLYWLPIKQELERMRHQKQATGDE
jgi:hypothetical protein